MNSERTIKDWVADIGTGIVCAAISNFIFDSAISIGRDFVKPDSFMGIKASEIWSGIAMGSILGGAIGGVMINCYYSEFKNESVTKVFSSLFTGCGVIAASVCAAIVAANSVGYDDTALVSGAVFGAGVIAAGVYFGKYILDAINDFIIAGERFFDNSYLGDYIIDRANGGISYLTEEVHAVVERFFDSYFYISNN